MKCSSCEKEIRIVNKHFGLCLLCNAERLQNNKIAQTSSVANSKKFRDEEFYERCFEQSEHVCEECLTDLPTSFRDEEGMVIARYRYSHIVPKSIAPELRYERSNINHLCLRCHSRWENGDKKNMKIYSQNSKKFPNHF